MKPWGKIQGKDKGLSHVFLYGPEPVGQQFSITVICIEIVIEHCMSSPLCWDVHVNTINESMP